MALIFFEGFNSPAGADPAYWSFAEGLNRFTPVQLDISQAALYKANPRKYTGGYVPAGFDEATATLALPTAHSGKTVYIGCGIRNQEAPSTYTYGIAANPGRLSKLFTIKNNAGTHVINVAFAPRPDWSVSAPSVNLGVVLTITQTVNSVVTSVNFRVPAAAMHLSAAGTGIVIGGSQRNDYCHYFEFKLDFLNSQFAVRYNDQLLGLHSNTAVEYATLAATSMQKLVLHGRYWPIYSVAYSSYPFDNSIFQDLYIADNTGSGVVSWLGADTYVVQPLSAAVDTSGWLTHGTSTGAAVVNSADGDATYMYTRTIGTNQTYTPEAYALWPTDITNIAAVKVSAVARSGPIPAAIKHIYENSSNVITPISDSLQLTAAYKVRATQLEQNPNTSVAWTKADIETGSFGVQSAEYVVLAALTPIFGTTTATTDGFTVQISNYDSAYAWAGTATASGTVVVSGTGLVTVTGVAANTSSTATITTTQTGYVGGTANVTETSLLAALTPTFGSPISTADGFTVLISNYDAAYTWAGSATASGSVAIDSAGLVTVTGLFSNTSSTATITTTQAGYGSGAATTSAVTSLLTAFTPAFGTSTATATGFTVQVTNYNAAYTWAGTATASGTVAINGSGLVTVTGVALGTSSTATITTTRTGHVTGSAPITATSFAAALNPAFGSTTATADGFTVPITNYDSSYTWAGTATASGTVAINGTGLVTVTNVALGTSSTATITTTKSNNVGGSNTVTETALLGAAFTPTFGTPTATATGFTVQITNYHPAFSWAGTATASGTVGITAAGLAIITGVAPGTSSTATITTTKVGYSSGAADVTKTSLLVALTPTFGSTTAAADGGSAVITNYDSAYTWGGGVPSGGTVVVTGSGSTGLATITGVAPGTYAYANITTTRAGYNGGVGYVVITTAEGAALTPTFGTQTATAGGFTVVITNYNYTYTWAGTSSESGGAVVVTGSGSTGLATVTGVASATSSTATITTTRAGYAGGSATTSSVTSLGAALTPTFGTPTATSTGFTAQISNYDAAYTWAGTATASGSVAINGAGLVTITGVAANTSSTTTITTTRTGYGSSTADVTAISLTVASGITVNMVTVGDIGNAADTRESYYPFGSNARGAVAYSYQIGKYDVTVSQYTAFLNAVASTDTHGLYDAQMGLDTNYTNSVSLITRSGSSGNYTYAVAGSMGNRPIVYVSWFDSARFANWMSNGQPSGAQTSTTTENGAYNLSLLAAGNAPAQNATNPNTGSAPTYRMPRENEWYKAAYYKGGSTNAGYWTYATQSNVAPGTTIGSSANQANYNNAIGHATDVGSFSGSGSFYGTFDQSGNVSQHHDLDGTAGGISAEYGTYAGWTRGSAGGDDYSDAVWISYQSGGTGSGDAGGNFGFRLVSATSAPPPAPAAPLGAALTPTFQTTTATADGFTLQISNYSSAYTWAGSATAGGSVSINGDGLATITGVAPGTPSSATITTTRAGYFGGTATYSWTSLSAAVNMIMVTVDNLGNAADAGSAYPGYGAVPYSYKIGKYEVTTAQYTAFLNAVGKTDTYGLYNAELMLQLGPLRGTAQISKSGTAGSYTYAVLNNTGNLPISGVSWFDSARFANWMSNGQPSGAQTSTTTENGAYNLNGRTTGNAVAKNSINPNTSAIPTFYIPTENQWYKAAYYKGGSTNAGYWAFATQSNSAPGTTIGSGANQAAIANGAGDNPIDVGSFTGSGSFYGTFDQTGNVAEWNDLDGSANTSGTTGATRGGRGGYWSNTAGAVSEGVFTPGAASSSGRDVWAPAYENYFLGFRLAGPV